MSHAVGSISLHLFRLLVFLPATFGFLQGHSQSISTTPSADCNTCDGALVVTTSLAGNCFYVIADAGGNNMASDFSAAGSVSFNALCAGFYSVTVSNGSENESSVINIPVAGFNPGAAAEETLCSNGTNFNLEGDIAGFVPGGTWTDPAGNALSSAVIDPSNAIEGVYQYSVLQGDCQVSTGVAVTLLQSANPGLSTTYLICETYAPFNLIDHLAGDPDAGGQWFLPGAVPMGGVFDPSTMNSTLFTYMIDNNDGCPPVFSTMMVVENLLPDPGDDTSVLMCDDSGPQSMFSMLEGSPTAGGSWYDVNDNAFPPNFDPSWMPEGIYRYHVSGATPCPGQDAFLTIGVVPASPSGENVSVNFCETDAQVDAFTLLGGSPLPGGSWTDSNGNATTHVIDPSTGAGTWIYTYPSVGCAQDFAEITVNVEALPNSGTATPSEICVSAITIDLNNLLSADATAGGTWFDENGFMVSPGVTIDGPGNFQWQYVTNGLVCPDDEAWYEVDFVNAPVAPSQLNFSVCANSPVNLNDLAGTSAGTTLWTDNLGLPVLPDQNLAADATYVATIASGNVCPDISVPLSIEVETPGFIPMNYNFEICSSGSLVNLESFVAGIDYTSGTWTSGGNTVSNLVSESALPGTFVFEDNSSVACAPAQLTLVINATLPANAGPDVSESVCDSSAPFSLNDLLGNGTDSGGNWWKEGLALTSDLIDPLLTSGGLYQYIVDGNGPCVADTAVVQLNVIPSPIADAGLDQEVCSGSAGFSIGSAPDADCTYTWTPGDFLDNAEVSNPEVINVPQTESSLQLTYVLTVTNNNCASTDTAQITVRPNPVAVLVGTPDVCLGEEAFFEVAGGIPTSWTPVDLFNDPTLYTQLVVPAGTSTIEVVVRNEWNCEDSEIFEVTVHPLPDVNFELEPTAGCAPLAITTENLSFNTPDVNYTWWLNDTPVNTNALDDYQLWESGSYVITLEAQSVQGCVATLSADLPVEVYTVPSALFSYLPENPGMLNPELELNNLSEGASTYGWSIDGDAVSEEENPELHFSFESTQVFEVCLEAISEFGCTDTHCVAIRFEEEALLYVPNAFTPDNDGINDFFIPVVTGYDPETYELLIYDRWGTLVFQSHDPRERWMGEIRNGAYYAPAGIYPWVLVLKEQFSPGTVSFSGHVSLIR